ncbi:MAG: hypothetical protein IJV31_09695 [Clostridia bacterium]|nr:hypothetical protein [Clostridia bacterium]
MAGIYYHLHPKKVDSLFEGANPCGCFFSKSNVFTRYTVKTKTAFPLFCGNSGPQILQIRVICEECGKAKWYDTEDGKVFENDFEEEVLE